MRRLVTIVLAGGLGLLGIAAAIDALRDRGDARPEARTAADVSRIAGRTSLAVLLRRYGVAGTLYASPGGCGSGESRPLRAFRLPALGSAETPVWHACRFSLSPDGGFVAAAGAAWQPDGLVVAAGGGETIEVTSPSPTWGLPLPRLGAGVPSGRIAHLRAPRPSRGVDDGLSAWLGDRHLPR
jgi:hypothetical protein